MKILVGITNWGVYHDGYLERLLTEYRGMGLPLHLVVFCGAGKDLGADVETAVRPQGGDTLALTWAHRAYFAEHVNDYDVFVYSEDDILITERNLKAWIQANEILGDSEKVPGFFIKEEAPGAIPNYCQAHASFGWEEVETHGEDKFAYFSNVHSACSVLSRKQLEFAIRSGNYLGEPRGAGPYAERELACSGPFYECGLRKLIPISRFQDFIVIHIPASYIGVLGTPEHQIRRQIESLGGKFQ